MRTRFSNTSTGMLLLLSACAIGLGAPACQGPTQSTRIACGSCEGQDRMVRLQSGSPGSDKESPRFAHPIALSPEDWRLILKSIHVQKQEPLLLFFSTKGPEEHAFTDDEIDYLSVTLSRVFANARPEERVVFALSRRQSADLSEVTSGSWFVSGQSLHLVLANYRFAITMPSVRELLWQDPMWTQAGPSYDLVPGTYQTVVREEGSPRRLLTATLPSLSIEFKQLLLAESLSSPAAEKSPSPKQLSDQPNKPSSTSLSLEERLQILRRLRDQGLITEEEYRSKKQQLLDRF